MKVFLKYFLTLSIVILTLTSCEQRAKRMKQINPEIFGVWQDGNGCTLHINMLNNQLTLIKFDNSNGVAFSNESLVWSKQSVFTNFATHDNKLSASFSDGFVMVNNNYCKQTLRKVDNK